ncbi:single-stranded DNA-binding protein [Pseudomonas aeruginosa]|uniref:single-stranded DNA-binding protein n=1 Tax=Pseudomonas aeruginosa TaxID=287 RepID=UPI0015E74C95|nr:single-stranded DNA-binding protein [Pseudomonas aeruginosa]
MALYRNKVELAGFLGDAPDIRYLPDGTATATLSLATTKRWKDKQSGQPKERTEWHRVVFFKRTAEVAGEYLGKGSHIFVDGELRNRTYQDKDGITRYVTEIVGTFQMIDRKPVDNDKVPSPPKDDAPPVTADDLPISDDIPF